MKKFISTFFRIQELLYFKFLSFYIFKDFALIKIERIDHGLDKFQFLKHCFCDFCVRLLLLQQYAARQRNKVFQVVIKLVTCYYVVYSWYVRLIWCSNSEPIELWVFPYIVLLNKEKFRFWGFSNGHETSSC